MLIGRDANHIMDTCQGCIAKQGIEGRQPAAIGFGQSGADFGANVGIIAVAWNEHQDRHEAVKAVTAHKNLCARPVHQMLNAHSNPRQVFFFDLEQFIAGIILDDIAQTLVIMAAGDEARARHHPLCLATQQRHITHHLVVGFGGEEADKPLFPQHFAIFAKALDANIVHHRAAMHARA